MEPWHMLRTDGKIHLEETDCENFSMIAMAGSSWTS
jgi:hypothetical protein